MKRFLLIAAAVIISTSAFAQAGGPVRQGSKCWAATDQRGFGFWDHCAARPEIERRARTEGRIGLFDEPLTTTSETTGFGGGGGGSGGGGGGGGAR